MKVLKEIGVTDCGLSNNHIFDYGIPGVRDTIQTVTEAGFGCTGFGENYEDTRQNLILEKDGKRIAIIAVCEHEYSYVLENRMGAMAEFQARSAHLHDGIWLAEWDRFCQEVRDNYIGNITRVYTETVRTIDKDIFEGRLHCEAHRDIIEWLCKHPWEKNQL